MYETLKKMLTSGAYSVVESFELPGRAAAFRSTPRFLFESAVGHYLEREVARGSGLWRHQARAMELLGEGRNVVIPTGTASGKSLIFRAVAFHDVMTDADARVLVFYPLKALASDQLRGWRAMASDLGLPDNVIGRIDGSIRDMKKRDAVLESSRIILMTPDVCHAWLMSRLSMPTVKQFLRRVSLIVMDEAHTLEGVFGSNFAFLIRRLLVARQWLAKEASQDRALKCVAATATIANPQELLRSVTGSEFEVVDESLDGSPRASRICAHLAAPPGEELQLARALQAELLRNSRSGGFITFIDSRKAVESLARFSQEELAELLGDGCVMPYRAGYDAQDREEIERRLQSGELRGVVSTSALELGIDLPHLTVGLNVGVPPTRKSYRQRLGRIGRASAGAFVVVAPPNAFTGFGTSFREYHDMSVEESYLYLDNRFMQFAHSRCLIDELDALGAGSSLPASVNWPSGLGEIFAAAKPGGDRPPEFDAIAQLGGDSPQRSYPLRNVGEISFRIAQGENADPLGEANESQALRECYPGGVYLHMARAWEVIAWYMNAYRPYIKVKPTSPKRQTRPRIRTWINAGVTRDDLLDQHFLISDRGFLAECQMQITEKVEGYTEVSSGKYLSYQELRQRNPNLRPRMRNFRTSGVVLSIDEPWFRETDNKTQIADRLTAIFAREYSILPQDVGAAATNISVRSMDGGGLRGDCMVVFDQTYGSLRLTERLFLNFGHLLDRLEASADAEKGAAREQLRAFVGRLKSTYAEFVPPDAGSWETSAVAPQGLMQVFAPGSIVCLREKGKMATDVRVIQPTMMEGRMLYQVELVPKHGRPQSGKRWVAAEFLEPSATADEWTYAWWNAVTQEFEDSPAGQDVDDD